MGKPQKVKDIFMKTITYLGSGFSLLFLTITMIFIFSNGFGLISFGLFTGDYHAKYYAGRPASVECEGCEVTDELKGYYSSVYGIALYDDFDRAGNVVIKVSYVHENSPLLNMLDTNNPNQSISLKVDDVVTRVAFFDQPSALTRNGASMMIQSMDQSTEIRELTFSTLGGGIRGSLITTLYLIGMSLALALPIGILTAIYFSEFAPVNRLTNLLRSFIETLTGVPSIIYGLLGITLFIPITVRLNLSQGANLFAGAMTMAVILLPVVIRTTEETLKSIPNSYRHASLALGANYTQTVKKVVLPNALPGIMTATFLAVGRIIGESAALIFVLGTAVKDTVRVNESSTTLAVHIWTVMTDEPSNIELASSIAFIILIIVLILNIGVKYMSYLINKKLRGVV